MLMGAGPGKVARCLVEPANWPKSIVVCVKEFTGRSIAQKLLDAQARKSQTNTENCNHLISHERRIGPYHAV